MFFMAAGRAIRFSRLVAAVFCRAVRGLSSAAAAVLQKQQPPLRLAAAAIPTAGARLMYYLQIIKQWALSEKLSLA